MSITNFSAGASSASSGIPITKVTVPALTQMKRQGKPISALTAYDYSSSRLADEAGIDLLLVGDSLAMVVLGHENTLAVTVDEMLHHTRAVRRAVRRALVVADMPFGSYHASVAEGVANAIRFVKEAGAEAVKIEGPRIELVRALTEAEIPVVGHLGLTPQSIHRMGGYRVQGRTLEAAARLKADALALAEAGAGAVVLEGVPREVAAEITAELPVPTIGIGAGPECDGQILVYHDLLSLTFAPAAKFVRRYADAGSLIRSAIEHYREDVEHRAFPSDQESYHLPRPARTAGRAVDKRWIGAEFSEKPTSAAKAGTDSADLMPGINPWHTARAALSAAYGDQKPGELADFYGAETLVNGDALQDFGEFSQS